MPNQQKQDKKQPRQEENKRTQVKASEKQPRSEKQQAKKSNKRAS